MLYNLERTTYNFEDGRETLQYDPMGNITKLGRTNALAALVDTLTYGYTGNRLASVYEGSADTSMHFQPGGTMAYTYDANGNVTSRVNSVHPGNNITAISYNYLNLPQSVTAAGGNATYTYDAGGRKLRSVIGGIATDYVDGIEWENGTLNFIHTEEGRIVKSGNNYLYEYVLRDHLGNTRAGFRVNGNGTVEDNLLADYYPFGLKYPAGQLVSTPKNRYLYNGKEEQDNTGLYDYGARFYDPVIARWGAVDKLAEHPNQIDKSPYAYAWNNPVKLNDPDGNCPICPILLGISAAEALFATAAAVTATYITYKAVENFNNSRGSGFSSTPAVQDNTRSNVVIDPAFDSKASEVKSTDSKEKLKVEVDDNNKIDRKLLDDPSKLGNAPTFKKDGTPVEIHHDGQKASGPFKELHRDDHRTGENYKKNHPDGQKPLTKEERKEFDKARREYWKNEYPKNQQ